MIICSYLAQLTIVSRDVFSLSVERDEPLPAFVRVLCRLWTGLTALRDPLPAPWPGHGRAGALSVHRRIV